MKKRATIILWLALRNLRRQARRSLLTALSMITGAILLMFSLTFGDGSHEQLIEASVRMGSGHITVQMPEFHENRRIDERLSAEVRTEVERVLLGPEFTEHVTVVTPQFAIDGLASSSAGARPVRIMGVDPITESKFTLLDEKVIKGRYLEPQDEMVAYVGTALLGSLKLDIDSRFVLTAQDVEGEITSQLVRVVGVFRTGIPAVDESLIHIPLSTVSTWFQIGDDVTNLSVLLDSSMSAGPLARMLKRELTVIELADLEVMDWQRANPQLASLLKIDDFGNYLFNGILFTIIALGIVNAVLISVLQRYREFGLLQALGLTPRQVGGLVLIEGFILTAVSTIVGIALGLFITCFFWGDGLDLSALFGDEEWEFSGVVMDPVLIPLFRPIRIIQGILFILTIGTLASLHPAYKASRIGMTEAMKFDR